jgi:hypothetical protein
MKLLVWWLVFAGSLVGVCGAQSYRQVSNVSVDELVSRMVENNRRRTEALHSYQGRREYQLVYSGFPGHREAKVEVDFTFQQPDQKQFTTVSQSGSKIIITRVFQKLMASEKEAASEGNRSRAALTPANYDFRLLGGDDVNGRPAYVLHVEPRTDYKYLYRGTVWVDAAELAVVKIEAEPAKRPSIWISRTAIHHTYQKVGDFWLPAENQSDTDVRLGGHANLTIRYTGYNIISASTPVHLAGGSQRAAVAGESQVTAAHSN